MATSNTNASFTPTRVYIAGLSHSGSTILGIALGSTEGAVSVGEVDATIRRLDQPQHSCTCGAAATDCLVWAPVFANEQLRTTREFGAGYQALYDSLAADLKPRLIVDTSKDPAALDALAALQHSSAAGAPGARLKVVFLLKDPRSYFVSHYRQWLSASRSAANSPDAARRLRHKSRRARTFAGELLIASLNWWWGNRRILHKLRAGGHDYIVLSYEEMVLNSARAEARLSEFLGLSIRLQDYTVRPEQQHILRGNHLRHDSERSSRLRYDYRWFHDPWVRRLGFIFAPILRWGAKNHLLGDTE